MSNTIIYSKKFRKSIKAISKKTYHFQKNLYDLVLSKTENLKRFPNMYPKVENSNYRKISIRNYIILYTIEINVVRVWDIIPTKSKKYNELY